MDENERTQLEQQAPQEALSLIHILTMTSCVRRFRTR